MKREITQKEVTELLEKARSIFEIDPSISYTFSNYDALASLSGLKDKTSYDEAYKHKYDSLHKVDPANPLYLNELANYYNYHGQSSLAESYFKWAYESMDLKYFDKDTAQFYSFRGVIRANLKDESAFEDFEKSLEINPYDSIAMVFYPMALVQRGEYAKVKLICEKALQSKSGDPVLPYLYLGLTQIYEPYMNHMAEITKSPKLKQTYAKKEYTSLIDMALIDKYTEMYKDNKTITNMRPMFDVFAIAFKIIFSDMSVGPDKLEIYYTKKEKQKLHSLIEWFSNSEKQQTLNAFSVYKNLGFIYFLLNERDKAILSFDTAVDLFPVNKGTETFSTEECYSGLLFMYFAKKDTVGIKNTLLRKIKSADRKLIADYNAIAYFYYYYEYDLDKAWEWALKAREIELKDFKSSLLLLHLSYLKHRTDLMDMYFKDVNESLTSNYDLKDLGLLASIYALLGSDAPKAYQFFNEVQNAMGDERCEECDEIIKEYIKVTPK